MSLCSTSYLCMFDKLLLKYTMLNKLFYMFVEFMFTVLLNVPLGNDHLLVHSCLARSHVHNDTVHVYKTKTF